jgi:hypothetical protein
MFNKYFVLLGMIPLAGCVTESRQATMVLHAPPVASANDEQAVGRTANTADPYGLQSAMALVRQQPWCYRRGH